MVKQSEISPEIRAPYPSVLVIDDDTSVLSSLKNILENSNFNVTTSDNPSEALNILAKQSFQLVLCDLKMPEMDGIAFLECMREKGLYSTVIIMSAFGTTDIALKTIRSGAYDYIEKPFNAEQLLLTINKARERELLREENRRLRAELSQGYTFDNIVGQSQSMLDLFKTVNRIADYKTTILISGESGTGKELIAKAVHFRSSRKNRKFIAINCGAIPENLLESELFGHRKGSFTDATKDRKGLFEEAHGGTLLLDEVGELPLHLQVKLLRVLQENEIRPVGESGSIPVDVRVIAATLRDLEQDVIDGRFRDDLYYRLNVIALKVPPLRERKQDIPLLVKFFIKKYRDKLGVNVTGIEKEALNVLMQYNWPGNIRELENCIERAIVFSEKAEISHASLPKAIIGVAAESVANEFLENTLSIKAHARKMEEKLIRQALLKTHGNRTHAAKLLEISHRALLYKLKEYGLSELHKS